VKAPKGFAKSYFSLASILAYSASCTLNSQIASVEALLHCRFSPKEESDEDESPPELLELHTFQNDFKPCLCSCFFNHLAHIMLHIHNYIPRCPYYTTYFAFRRTGVHPPRLSFS